MDANERRLVVDRLRPYVERARLFSGWSFPDIKVRPLEEPRWDYRALVRDMSRGASAVLDLGTGGGELLAGVRDSLPERVVATEEWHVNAPVAYQRLQPLGADVVWCRSLFLPFREETFDLVIDRHEELDPSEVARVLRPGGRVVTQQVGREHWRELRRHFPRMTDFGDVRGSYASGFASAGLLVARNEQQEYKLAYGGLGDVVFMLFAAPWEIPDFDVERDLEALLALEAECSTEEGLVLTWSRFLLVAEKPSL
jgi:SAM-dependent methyltransferase